MRARFSLDHESRRGCERAAPLKRDGIMFPPFSRSGGDGVGGNSGSNLFGDPFGVERGALSFGKIPGGFTVGHFCGAPTISRLLFSIGPSEISTFIVSICFDPVDGEVCAGVWQAPHVVDEGNNIVSELFGHPDSAAPIDIVVWMIRVVASLAQATPPSGYVLVGRIKRSPESLNVLGVPHRGFSALEAPCGFSKV